MKIDRRLLSAALFFVILLSGCASEIHDAFLGESIQEVIRDDIRYAVYAKANERAIKKMYLLLPPAGYSGEEYLRKWISLLDKNDAILVVPNLSESRMSGRALCEKIRAFLIEEARSFERSADHFVLIGESNGAIIGFELLDHFPDLFQAAAIISGSIDQKILEELISNAKAIKTQILIVHGENDTIFKINSMKKNYELLKNASVAAELRVVPGMGHGSDVFTDEEVVSWIKTKITQ